jgi:hypothetical protein
MTPPARAGLAGVEIDLVALAQEICRRYREEFPDEEGRYGDAGIAWCLHDNQHILNWAVGARNGLVDMERELAWLARVLAARDFPVDRLARDLEIAAEVAPELAEELTEGARFVRATSSP